eukprot:scaffold9610_cov60-Phaeocystis_antarctica.AAC.2
MAYRLARLSAQMVLACLAGIGASLVPGAAGAVALMTSVLGVQLLDRQRRAGADSIIVELVHSRRACTHEPSRRAGGELGSRELLDATAAATLLAPLARCPGRLSEGGLLALAPRRRPAARQARLRGARGSD